MQYRLDKYAISEIPYCQAVVTEAFGLYNSNLLNIKAKIGLGLAVFPVTINIKASIPASPWSFLLM